MKKQMTKNIKKAMILFWAVMCILGIKGNVYAQDIKLVAPIITSSQMENGNFVIRWRTSEELKGQEYKIYCATSKDGTYEYVTTTPDYSYTEYYPNKGMAYYYKITTVYTDYETEREIESNPVYTGGIVNPLEIPTITEAKAGNNHSVTIMWNKTEDCLGYAIYRSESVDGEYKWISNVENKSEIFWWQEYEPQATFTEKNLELGKTYYYKIRPYVTYYEGTFYGEFSNYKSCQVTINGTKVKSAKSKKKRTNTIIWEKNGEADGYIIYYSKKIDGSYKKLKTYNSRNKLTYTHKKLTNGVAYYYKIQAYKNYKGKKLLGEMSPFEKYCDYFTYKNESYESRCKRIFGKKYYKKYKNAKQASKHVTTVAVKVWDKQGGRKFTRKFYLTVNKGIAPSVKEMFKEIYKSKERFPIHEMGCYNWRGNSSTSEHCLGLAFDINSNENYMIDGKKVLAGSFWKPKKNKYSIPLNCKLVKILEKYGFERGLWGSRRDYMHFSYFGT